MKSWLDTCPYVGPQRFANERRERETYECKKDMGFCVLYSVLYGHLRILGPNISEVFINDVLTSGVLGQPKEKTNYQDQLLQFVLQYWMMVRVEITLLGVQNIEHLLRMENQLRSTTEPSPTLTAICSQTFNDLWLAESKNPIFLFTNAPELKNKIEMIFVKPQFLWQASDNLIRSILNQFNQNDFFENEFFPWIYSCRYDFVKQLYKEDI
jgi:hypothetical protein